MRSQVLLWSQLLSSEHVYQQLAQHVSEIWLTKQDPDIFARSDPTCPHSLHVSSPPPALVPTVAPRTAKLLHTFDHSSFPSVLPPSPPDRLLPFKNALHISPRACLLQYPSPSLPSSLSPPPSLRPTPICQQSWPNGIIPVRAVLGLSSWPCFAVDTAIRLLL